MTTPTPTPPTPTAEDTPQLPLTPRGARQLPPCPGAPGPKPRVPMSAEQRGGDDGAVAKRRLFGTLDVSG